MLFVAAVLGAQCSFICKQSFFATANSNFFFCKQFLHFKTPLVFHFIAVSVLFVTAFSLPPAPYMGFGVRLAGRCPAPAAVFQFGFCSGLDKHLSTFFCYLQLSNFFGLRFRGWKLKLSSPTPSPIVACNQFGHPNI